MWMWIFKPSLRSYKIASEQWPVFNRHLDNVLGNIVLLDLIVYIPSPACSSPPGILWSILRLKNEEHHYFLWFILCSFSSKQYSVYPIIWAAGRGHSDIVHLLLQHGAKVNCSDKVSYVFVMFHFFNVGTFLVKMNWVIS